MTDTTSTATTATTTNNSNSTTNEIQEEAERAAELMTNNNPELNHLTEADRLRIQHSITEKLITAHKTENLNVKELADKLEGSLGKEVEEEFER